MINSEIISTIQKRLDDTEGADADTPSILRELRVASTKLASYPIVKHRLFPTTSTAITIVTGQTEYTLPSDFNYNVERAVYNSTAAISSQRNLIYVAPDELYDTQDSAGSYLERFTIRGNKLVLGAVPTSSDNGITIEILYNQIPDTSVIANDSTETLLGKKYPHILINMAVIPFLLAEPDLAGVADRYQKMLDEDLENMRQELETNTSPGVFHVDFTGPY